MAMRDRCRRRALAVCVLAAVAGAAGTAYACPDGPLDADYDIIGAYDVIKELYGAGFMGRMADTGSMEPEYGTGDIVVINQTIPFDDIERGDVISFRDPFGSAGDDDIIHRAHHYDGDRWITKGDANAEPADFDVVGPDNYNGMVVGKYEKIGEFQHEWIGAFAGDKRTLRNAGLDDCRHFIDDRYETTPFPFLKLGTGVYAVDPDVHYVVSHVLIWFGHFF